ncbi:MAG: hypothetical protein M1147_09730 [Nitrospirae bacterium]|nr:hypothetical protein [Nitrospirota bacterium]MCL5978375.1 hypothetical protein [Nitrospirota bacterium]
MFRKELPRLYELRDQIKETDCPNAYFRDFENKLKDSHWKEKYLDLEKELQGLEQNAWEFLKNEACPYLIKSGLTMRGWEQLFNILQSQARAYNYLKRIGCTNVQFIPRSRIRGMETPDLEGMMGLGKVLCEVKTINMSDEEAKNRHNVRVRGYGDARDTEDRLGDGFFKKLESDITGAKKQLESYDPDLKARRLVFIVPNFDDFFCEYKDRYFRQIDHYFSENPAPPGIEIVLYNQKTAAHKSISMNHVTIVNE